MCGGRAAVVSFLDNTVNGAQVSRGPSAGAGAPVRFSHNRGTAMPHVITTPFLTALTLALAFAPMASADLQRYVMADDPASRWEHVAQTSPQEGLVVHEL